MRGFDEKNSPAKRRMQDRLNDCTQQSATISSKCSNRTPRGQITLRRLLSGKRTSNILYFSANHKGHYKQFLKIVDALIHVMEQRFSPGNACVEVNNCGEYALYIRYLKTLIMQYLDEDISDTINEIFDIVDLMMELVIGDDRISPRVKKLVLQLQFPMLLKALLDESFLINHLHPVSRLVKNLLKLDRRKDVRAGEDDAEIIQKIENIVTQSPALYGASDEFYNRIARIIEI